MQKGILLLRSVSGYLKLFHFAHEPYSVFPDATLFSRFPSIGCSQFDPGCIVASLLLGSETRLEWSPSSQAVFCAGMGTCSFFIRNDSYFLFYNAFHSSKIILFSGYKRSMPYWFIILAISFFLGISCIGLHFITFIRPSEGKKWNLIVFFKYL